MPQLLATWIKNDIHRQVYSKLYLHLFPNILMSTREKNLLDTKAKFRPENCPLGFSKFHRLYVVDYYDLSEGRSKKTIKILKKTLSVITLR